MNPGEKSILIETQDLTRHFGGLVAVDGVSLQVKEQDFHSIIGPNGAGKTTLLNLLSGALKPTRGQVFFKSREITGLPPHRMAHLGIGRSYQITNVFPGLSVLENVRLAAQALGQDNYKVFTHFQRFPRYLEIAHSVLNSVGLASQASTRVLSLAHGDKRRLELALLLAQDSEVFLLDEPTAGLATEQVPEFMALVKRVSEEGHKTIILVEHNMSVVMRLSNRITVMHQGRLLADGTPEEIATDAAVQNAYLGEFYGDLIDPTIHPPS